MGGNGREGVGGAAVTGRPSPDVVAVVGRKRSDSKAAVAEAITSNLKRHGRERSSSIRRKDSSITPMRQRSGSARFNHAAAAGTMTGEQLMTGLGPGHNAARLLLQLSDPKATAQRLMQDLANTAQIGSTDTYGREFKAALVEQHGGMIDQQKAAISEKLTSSQIHILRWSLQAAARQQQNPDAVVARMSFMLEALCAQFDAGDVMLPKNRSDDMDTQLAGIVRQLSQARRQANGKLDAAELDSSRISYDVHPDSLERFRESSRKGVCEQFRSQCADGNNIYVKGGDKPINSSSLRGQAKAGSSDLLRLCNGNGKCSLAVSRAIVALQNPQAASDLFGSEPGRRLPLPEVGGQPADNVTFGSIRQRFDLKRGEAGKVLLRVHTDAVLDVAATKKRHSVGLESKLNPAQSKMSVDLLLEVSARGEVKPVRMDYDYSAQPVLGIEVEDGSQMARRVKTAAIQEAANSRPNGDGSARTRRQLPAPPSAPSRDQSGRRSLRLPKPVRQLVRSMSVSASERPAPARPDAGPAGEKNSGLPPAASPRPAAPADLPPPGKPAPASAPAPKIDMRTIESPVWFEEDDDLPATASNDVLAAVDGALALADSLIEGQADAAAGALQVLASSGVRADAAHNQSHRFSVALAGHVSAMDTNQFDKLNRTINSPEMAAIEAALAAPSRFTHNSLSMDKCRHAADMIGKIRQAGGGGFAPAAAVSDSHRQIAGDAIGKFTGELERSTSELDYPPLGARVGQRFSAGELATLAADAQHDYVCKDLLDEAATGSYKVLPGEGQPYRWLVNPLGLAGRPQQFRQTVAQRLLDLCQGRKPQTLALSRVLAQESGELIKPAAESLRAVAADPRLDFSLQAAADGSIEVTVDCQDALRQYDPDDDAQQRQELNPNFSSWQGQLKLQVAVDGTVTPIGDSRKAVLVARGGAVSDFADYRVAAAAEPAAPIGAIMEFMGEFAARLDAEQGRRVRQMAADAGLIRDNLEKLQDAKAVDADQVAAVNQRLDLMADMQRRMESLISEQVGGADVKDRISEHVRNARTDLELLQFDMDEKKIGWARGDMNSAQIYGIHGILDALKLRMGNLAENLSWFAEQADALSGRGGDPAGQRSPAARTAAAQLQTEAAYAAVAESFAAALDAGETLDDGQTDLLGELSRRRREILVNVQRVQNGQLPTYSYGRGAAGEEQRRASDQVSLDLKKFRNLPSAHPLLSEGQLVDLRIRHFLDEHPRFRPFFGNFSDCYAAHLVEATGSRDWGTIRREFVDTAGGSERVVASTITPAARFAEEGFAASYKGANVAPEAHFTGIHAVNLAHTGLSGQDGRSFYRGLRHGIVDNYLLTPEKLRVTSRLNLARLHQEILGSDRQWQQWAGSNGGGDRQRDLALLRTEAGSQLAAQLLRPQANLNAAREVIQAAVATDPQLLAAAREGRDVELTVNAISMVTPSALAGSGDSPAFGRQQLENHRRALEEASREPIPIAVVDEQGQRRSVSIKARVRAINCEIGRYGASLPPPAGQGSAPSRAGEKQENLRPIEEMIGSLAEEGIGGAAADRVFELEADADAADATAFATKGQKAGAIRRLVAQLKRILSGRQPDADPYQVPVRLALLSFLLGQGTAVSCETGNARTGNLDARVKHLAAAMAADASPEADGFADRLQQGKYLLRTGNSEFHNAGCGRFGYRLDDAAPLRSKINDPAAVPEDTS